MEAMEMTEYKYNVGDVVKVKYDGNGKSDEHGLINHFSEGDIVEVFDRRRIIDGTLKLPTYYGEGNGKSGWCPEYLLILVKRGHTPENTPRKSGVGADFSRRGR